MPVRIYDISKKLGLENKEVLSKAKELGIAAARVASSSLDKITAEYLEQQLVLAHPNLATSPVASAPTAPVQSVEPIMLVRAPEDQPEAVEEQQMATATALLEPEETLPELSAPGPQEPEAAEPAPEIVEAPAEAVAKATPPPPPPPPAGPKVGDKVGFIQLPTKPTPKPIEKRGDNKLPARPMEPRRTDFSKRGDIRSVRPGTGAPGSPAGATKFGPQKPALGGKPAEPTPAKIALPADAKVISIKPPIVVRELAEQLKQKPFKIIADLMGLGVFATVN